jgi:hypothetical protein
MIVAAAAASATSACQSPEVVRAPIPPVSTGKVRVRVFTEPSPVKSVTALGRFVFVATESGVERWDGNDSVVPLSTGVSGNQVVALARDADRRWLWILTDGGIGYYDAAAEVYQEVVVSPGAELAAMAREGASLASATDDGVWLGSARGLVHVSARGTWTPTAIKEPIRALARDRAGWLWVATTSGLVVRKPSGDIERIGVVHGCQIDQPRLFAELPGDQLLVIGVDDTGQELLAIGK